MKKKIHFSLKLFNAMIVFAITAFAFTACSNPKNTAATEETTSSLLYAIEGNGLEQPSYLFGTMHVSDSIATRHVSTIVPYISKSSVFCNEVDVTDMEPSMELMGMMFLSDTTLDMLYTENEMSRIRVFISEKMGPAGMMLLTMKPFWIAAALTELEFQSNAEEVLDVQLQQAAEAAGCAIQPLETVESQMKAVDGIPLRDQAEMLLESIDEYDEQKAITEELKECYAKADLDCLNAVYRRESFTQSMDDGLVNRRNEGMFEKLQPIVAEGRPVFCAVGALHLSGETGLINAFRRAGYSVKAIPMP